MDTTYKLIGTKLYVVQTQKAEVIDFEDISEATLIYIQPELLDSYKVLNPDYSALMKPYSYTAISVKLPEWAKEEPGPEPPGPEPSFEDKYFTVEMLEDGDLSYGASESGVAGKTISYSTDNGESWTDITSTTEQQSIGTFSTGDKILFKGTNDSYANITNGNNIGGTAQVNIYGNIMSLIYGDNFVGQTSFPSGSSYNFCYLFKNSKIVDASNLILPATTLTNGCYNHMFDSCTSLTKAPKLSATTLASLCYNGMFKGCTSLTNAPELPATTLASGCYLKMFSGCTSLTKAPSLPATTLAIECYRGMFQECSHLNYVKCLATDISAYNCLGAWLDDVAATGTFVTADNPPAWSRDENGIPAGWTVETASA